MKSDAFTKKIKHYLKVGKTYTAQTKMLTTIEALALNNEFKVKELNKVWTIVPPGGVNSIKKGLRKMYDNTPYLKNKAKINLKDLNKKDE